MKFRISILFILFLANLSCSGKSGSGRGNDRPQSPDYPIKNTKAYNSGPAMLFGDSIANGTGASSKNFALYGCLSKIYGVVVNYAVDGATTEDALPVLNRATSENPSIVIISLGGNDVMANGRFGNFPESETFRNIRRIFQTFTAAGSLVIHLGIEPPKDPRFPDNTSRLKKIKNIAVEEGVIFLDKSFEGLWKNPKYMSDDIHPNDDGYKIICGRVLSALGPHLMN